MAYITYEISDRYPVAILSRYLDPKSIEKNYIAPLEALGIPRGDIIVFDLAYDSAKKVSAATMKAHSKELIDQMLSVGVEIVLCNDAKYFKTLTKLPKAEGHLGYHKPCRFDEKTGVGSSLKICLGVNYKQVMYNPEGQQPKLDQALAAVHGIQSNTYTPPGSAVLKGALYPSNMSDIAQFLEELLTYDVLTADIEAFSLKFYEAGIGSIGFSMDQHHGGAFLCDYADAACKGPPAPGRYGEYQRNPEVRKLLRGFLERYRGTLIWHNSPYDLKVLIFTLFMEEDHTNYEGMLHGLDVLTRLVEDTKIIAYLATNTCAGNELGLKELAQEFAGSWAKSEIKDIRRLPPVELLEYNVIDTCSTWYVFNKYTPKMVNDNQERLYRTLMLPSNKMIIQTELVGMPLIPEKVQEARQELEKVIAAQQAIFDSSPLVAQYELLLAKKLQADANAKLKVKQHPLSKFLGTKFNPNSDPQKRVLIYEVMDMPVIDLTDGKQAATGGDALEKLINHTTDPDKLAVLGALLEQAKAEKVLTSFIPAFEKAIRHSPEDPRVYLHGNFNIGGTVSGRLSSSGPNLQNIPSGSVYGKLIKACFAGPPDWLMGGADFASLEDRISALQTRDSNKLKVYLDGFDSHSLRAHAYFSDQMPDIDPTTVSGINSIKKKYPELRDSSKGPTFLLTYGGTHIGLMKTLGFPEKESLAIEENYHELYVESDEWVQARLDEASVVGYVTGAFGLRLRTPLLAQVIRGHKTTPYAAEAEGRTAGNALGQGYGLLNNRAAVEFMERVWASPYRLKIFCIGLIHDAIYLIFPDDLEIIDWINVNLINCMNWQELPEIQHDEVKLEAELDIFYPDWSKGFTLPNNCSVEDLKPLADKHLTKLSES